MEEERVDLSLICRACKCVSPTMKSIFEGLENGNISVHNPRIDEMLMACAAVQVNKDFKPVVDYKIISRYLTGILLMRST